MRLVARLQSCLKLQPTPAPPTPPTPVNPPHPPQPQPPVRRYSNRRQRQQRHTVGVSREELADARRWLQETGQAQPSNSTLSVNDDSLSNNELEKQKPVSQVFRPVKFIPNQNQSSSNLETPIEIKPLPQTDLRCPEDTILSPPSYPFSQEILKADSGSSLQDYDPSLVLFTPSQSVQIAVHKAAINKQISAEESKREGEREESNSEDGDVSSLEEMADQGLEDAISSAQRLLQIASDKKTPTLSRFHDKNYKKQKMKRANTIDIPKPLNFSETEHPSYDEYETATMEQNKYINNKSVIEQTLPPPYFQPKTENDLKFLAFLKHANKKESSTTMYNPSARGGQPWTNRFVNLKTAFESLPETKKPEKTVAPSVAQIWQENSTKHKDPYAMRQTLKNRTPKPLQTKLPWNSKQEKEEEGVIIGSLTVKPAPGTINKFSHAPKSAFRPIEKKPVSRPQAELMQPQKVTFQPQPKPLKDKNNGFLQKTIINTETQHRKEKLVTSASGSVKQLATQKFENVLSKPIIKQYPTIQAIQDNGFNTNGIAKQNRYVEQTTKPTSVNTPPIHLPPQNFPTSIVSAHRFLTGEAPEYVNLIKIPPKTPTKGYKDQSEHSPPKQYINSPPICKNYSEPFEYTVKSSLSKESGNHSQESLLDDDSVPYYSQEPVYVQHSTYTQPLISQIQPSVNHSQMCSQLQTPQEYPVKYSPHQYNRSHAQAEGNEFTHKPENYYNNPNISLPSSFQPGPTSRKNNKREEHHRFSDEALVPNPIILGQIYKPSTPEYLLHEAPCTENNSVPLNNKPSISMNNPLLDTACYEPLVTTSNKPAILLPLISNNLYDNNSSQGSLVSSKLSDSSSSIKHYLNIPYEHGNDLSPAISSISKSPYFDESVNSSTVPSPHWNTEDLEDNEVSMSEGAEIQTAVAKVMGQAQCQQATTMSNRTKHRFDDDKAESESLLRVLIKSPTNMARKQSLEKSPNCSESNNSCKSPLMEKRSVTPIEIYSHSNLANPSVISPHSDRLQNVQRPPISSAASAFRPLVKNLSKQPDLEVHKPPPIPLSSVKKSESDNRFSQTKSSPQILPHATNLCEAESLHKPQLSSCRSPSSSSPVFPNVLQKSESWHQLVKEQMAQGRHPPPRSPRLTKTKSSHSLAFPKQYEAHLTPDVLAVKQSTVDQYLKSSIKQSSKGTKHATRQKTTVSVVKLDDNLENVDEAFESLFQQVAKRK